MQQISLVSPSIMSDSLQLIDCRLLGSSVHEIFQARILECVAIPFSRESSQLRDRTRVSYALQAYSLLSEPPGKYERPLRCGFCGGFTDYVIAREVGPERDLQGPVWPLSDCILGLIPLGHCPPVAQVSSRPPARPHLLSRPLHPLDPLPHIFLSVSPDDLSR